MNAGRHPSGFTSGRTTMETNAHKGGSPLSTYEFQAASMSVQDALIVLAIRLMGGDIRRSPSSRQHIIALARGTPLFLMEDYHQTRDRVNRFINWAGTPTMDDLFAHALGQLRGAYRREALEWSAINTVVQQATDEKVAMLHHIGKALGFSAAEVEERFAQARRKPAGKPNADEGTG
jgi:hypothetical protein